VLFLSLPIEAWILSVLVHRVPRHPSPPTEIARMTGFGDAERMRRSFHRAGGRRKR
jgi:hypothetical protein